MFLGENQISNVDCTVHMGVGLHQYVSQNAFAYAESRIIRARSPLWAVGCEKNWS